MSKLRGMVAPGPMIPRRAFLFLVAAVSGCALFQGRTAPVAQSPPEIPVMIRAVDGGQARVMTRGEAARWPTFSSDGRVLAYYSDKLGSEDIYSINVDDRRVSRLTSDESDENRPVWSPDGQRVVYSAYRSGNWSLFGTSRAGAPAQQLTMDRSDEVAPAFSRDGRYLAFQSNRKGNYDIWIMEIASGKLTQLTFDPADDGTPCFSPDGRMLAFDSIRSGNWDIYVVPVAGGVPKQLTTHPADDARPNWTGDGRYIVHASFERGTIMRIPADGGPVETLVDLGPGGLDQWGFSSGSVSPDGKWLAFSQVIDPGSEALAELPILIRRGPDNVPATDTEALHGGQGVLRVRNLLESELESGLQFVHETTLPPGASIGLHEHRGTEEVYYIIRGRGVMIVDSERAGVGPGDAVLTRNGQEHGLVNTGTEDLVILIFEAEVND